MNSFYLYLWQICDGIVSVFVVLAIIFGCVGLCWTAYEICDNKCKNLKKALITCGVFLFCLIMANLTPNTKQATIIFGVPILMEYSKDIGADKIPKNVVEYINKSLQKEVDKILETKKEIK